MAQRQNMSALQLEDLPDEMLEKVLSYLKIGDLIQSIINFPTGFISFLKSPLVTRKRLMKTVGRLK